MLPSYSDTFGRSYQTLQSSTLSSGRHPSDSSRWMTEKQTNDGPSQSVSPATWRLFAIHFAQENYVPGPLRLQLWLQTKAPKILAQRDIATYIAISTSFDLFPLPLSSSTTKTPQFLAGSLVKILDNFVCSWVFAVARGHLGKLMMSTGQMGCMSTDEQGWAMQCLPWWALVHPAPGDSLDPSDRLD